MNNVKKIFISLLILLNLINCKFNQKTEEITTLLTHWNERTIIFPDSVLQVEYNSVFLLDSFNHLDFPPYKVLVYFDSIGCDECKMRLPEWKVLMETLNDTVKEKVTFLFFLADKTEKDAKLYLRRFEFHHPIFLDKENQINKLNNFPSNPTYQVFLLDKDNKVKLIGNPTINIQMWDLYKEILETQ